jgi:hypothetical protein
MQSFRVSNPEKAHHKISQTVGIVMACRFPTSAAPSTSFVSRRVNNSTFLVIEDDGYGEQPHIYVKIYPEYLLISDTGCNKPRSKKLSLTSLREYLENYPVSWNENRCLNPDGSNM